MSKITFRADDDLVRQLEEFDASKSEVMREALREYLGESERSGTVRIGDRESLDAMIAERVDALVADRLDGAFTRSRPQDVNVNIRLEGDPAAASVTDDESRKTRTPEGETAAPDARDACKRCGEDLSPSSVYCPNCGEKSTHRIFCDCGDELRSDWSFCPGCGRRTPAADVLDQA